MDISYGSDRRDTVLITGATGGLGSALACEFAQQRCDLVLVGRNKDKLARLAARMQGDFGVSATAFACDLAQPDAAGSIYDAVRARGIEVDVLANNAGFGFDAPFIEGKWQRQRELLQVNMVALTELCYLFAQDMARRGSGGILNVASVAGFVPGPYMATYYASKAYVQSLTQALHVELEPYGIHVTALCPGPVDTGFWDAAGAGHTVLARLAVSAGRVAVGARRALSANRALCAPGFLAKTVVASSRVMPRMGIARIAALLQKPRER